MSEHVAPMYLKFFLLKQLLSFDQHNSPHVKLMSVLCLFFHLKQCKIITLTVSFDTLQQQAGPSPVPVPQQTVKTFTPANPAGLKNPGQYQQPNTLGSQLYTVGILVTYIY